MLIGDLIRIVEVRSFGNWFLISLRLNRGSVCYANCDGYGFPNFAAPAMLRCRRECNVRVGSVVNSITVRIPLPSPCRRLGTCAKRRLRYLTDSLPGRSIPTRMRPPNSYPVPARHFCCSAATTMSRAATGLFPGHLGRYQACYFTTAVSCSFNTS